MPPLNQTDSLSGSDLSGKDFGAGLTFEETDIQGTGIRKIRTEPLQAEFVFISPGEFVMGDGGERHRVILTKGFFMQTTPVTQRQWKEMAGSNPSQFRDCDDCPVETVSWDDVNEFVILLNRKAGTDRFRLPTEAEWEYACRAGSETAYCFGDDHRHLGKYAWFDRNSGEKTHPVAQKKPNAWGLYDMHGNVCEWCQDWYDYYSEMTVTDPVGDSSGYRRIFRGGSWKFDAQRSRSAYRGRVYPDTRHPVLGFRLVLMS
ncbi:MAG: formylglycine-generating enzyme family protein [Desulfobacterales bacterium]